MRYEMLRSINLRNVLALCLTVSLLAVTLWGCKKNVEEPTTSATQPTASEPIDHQSPEDPSGETQPTESQPTETQPIETQPTESQPTESQPTESQPTESQPTESQPTETQPIESQPTEPQPTEDISPMGPYDGLIFLGNDLIVTDVGAYTGSFIEDGSNDPVTNVLMLVVRNDNERDLQLARIKMEFSSYTAEFEVTNLPAGESVVLLEKNRRTYEEVKANDISAHTVAFFPEKMSLHSDVVKISGDKGTLQVENLSDKTLGEMYIYYKHSASDILYGGITYRTRIDAGLEPGAIANVLTGHYDPDSCKLLAVDIVP